MSYGNTSSSGDYFARSAKEGERMEREAAVYRRERFEPPTDSDLEAARKRLEKMEFEKRLVIVIGGAE